MSGLTDLLSAMLRRAGQQAQATREGTLGVGPDPTAGPALHYGAAIPGQNVPVLGGLLGAAARVPVTALQVAGLGNEAFDNAGQAVSGEGMVALANIMRASRAASLTPDLAPTPMSQLAEQIAAAGPLHPLAAQDLARHSDNPVVSWGAGGLGMLANPANYLGGIGAAADVLRVGASPAARALGTALKGVQLAGEYSNAPGAAAFSGAWRGLRGGPVAGLLAAADELGAQRLVRRLPDTVGGFLPGGAAPGARPPTVVRPAPQTQVPRLVRPAPQEQVPRLVRRAPQTGIPPAIPPEVYLRSEPTFAYGPPTALQEAAERLGVSQRPSQAPNTIADLLGAARGLGARGAEIPPAPTPWEDFVGNTAATYRSPAVAALTEALSAPQAAATVADLGENVSRDAVIQATANRPPADLTPTLRALHNAVYPGGQADFAIPALTGVGARDFRTSWLTDHPTGNVAEPYLDYLVSRVQGDKRAAARLGEADPDLLADVLALPPHPTPVAEQKVALQQRLGAGKFTAGATPEVAAATPEVAGATNAVAAAFDTILASGDNGRMSGELPAGTAFWERRLGVGPDEARALLDGAVADGRLGVGPDGALRFKPKPLSNVDIAPEGAPRPSTVEPLPPAPDQPSAGELLRRYRERWPEGTPVAPEVVPEADPRARLNALQDEIAAREDSAPNIRDYGGNIDTFRAASEAYHAQTRAMRQELDTLATEVFAARSPTPATPPAVAPTLPKWERDLAAAKQRPAPAHLASMPDEALRRLEFASLHSAEVRAEVERRGLPLITQDEFYGTTPKAKKGTKTAPPVTPTQARDELFADAADGGVADVAQGATPDAVQFTKEAKYNKVTEFRAELMPGGEWSGDAPHLVIRETGAGTKTYDVLNRWITRGGGRDTETLASGVTKQRAKALAQQILVSGGVDNLGIGPHEVREGFDRATLRFADAGTKVPTPGGDIAAGGGGGGLGRAANLATFMKGAHPALLNADGTAKVFYHGTGVGDFTQFADPERAGAFGRGVYFTESPKYASSYAGDPQSLAYGGTTTGQQNIVPRGEAGVNVKPVYINLKNPLVVAEHPGFLALPKEQMRAEAERLGHDGIILTGAAFGDVDKGIEELVVFDPAAIKSATGNRGTYDPNDPSLLRAAAPAIGRATEAGVGALAGGAIGGAAGLTQGDTPAERRANALKGAGAGAFAGANVGVASPELLALGRQLAPGAARNLAPLGAIAREGAAAMRAAAATGEKGLLPGQGHAMGYIRSLRKTGLFVVPRNALGAMGNVAMGGGDLPQALRYAGEFWRNMPTLLPALRAAGTDEAARAAAMHAALPADMQAYGEQGIAALMTASGSAYERNAADLGAAHVHPAAGALRGLVLGAASPRVAVLGAPSLALGAVEGATLPARAAMQNAFATAIDVPARVALSFPSYQAGLKAEAPALIAKVAALDPALAGTLDRAGTFDPADLLANVPAGQTPPPALQALADEWAGVQDAVARHAGQQATDRMGDFTTTTGAAGLFNTLFPGGIWNVQQAAVLARAAAEHPALALAALRAMHDDYEAHLAAGDPQRAGTWRLDDTTPGFGALVRLAAGGKGSFYVNPAYPFSPFSGETLNLPRQLDPRLNPGQNLYDRAAAVGSALGLAVNPEIQLAAYKEGASETPMTNPLRLEPVGQYLDARLGLPRTANPLAQALDPQGSTQNLADINLQLRQGKYLDPAIARAGSELIYEATNRPAGDPRNAQHLAELRDHGSPLYQQALDRALGGKAALAALNEALPASGQAESQTARDVGIAQTQLFQQGIPFTKAQVEALADAPPGEPTAQMALQQAMDAARMGNSLLRVNDVATPAAQSQALLDDWKRRFSGLGLFPAVYQQALAQQGERLGTVPAGTAAATQALYDALLAGQRYGPVPLWPGGPPPQLDPTPIYQLQDYFNRGGR